MWSIPGRMELTYFELSQARTWAMCALNATPNMSVLLDVSEVDGASRWFLERDLPRSSGGVELARWSAVHNDSLIEFSNRESSEIECTTVHLRAFVETFAMSSSLYFGLYDGSGARFVDACLVVWDREHPEVSNQGRAPGRCPERIEVEGAAHGGACKGERPRTVMPTMVLKYHVLVGSESDSGSDLVEFRNQDVFREYLVYCLLNNDYFDANVELDDVVIRAYDHLSVAELLTRARSVRSSCALAVVEGGDAIEVVETGQDCA